MDKTIYSDLGLDSPTGKLSEKECIERGILLMINEASLALIEDQIVESPEEVDLAMIMGTAGGWIVGILIMNFYFNNKLQLSMTRFFNGVLKNILPVYFLCLVIGYFLTKISHLTWTTFIIQVVVFSAFYSVLMYNFALNSSEKQIILGFLPNYLQKK